MTTTICTASKFLSTLSLRRATNDAINGCNPDFISIHALLAESDIIRVRLLFRLPKFLSTLSLRRATGIIDIVNNVIDHFYPRSPCGERQNDQKIHEATFYFYPRSPCGERHYQSKVDISPAKISIHALLAESDLQNQHQRTQKGISIHALLAESDPPFAR